MLEDKIYFGIGGERVPHYASIELEQTINDHHTFTVKVPQAVIEDPLAVSLTKSKIWHGKTINIVLANRNNFLGIVESTTLEKENDHVGNLIVIKGYSKTILLEKVPSSYTFEDTTLDEIVKRVIRNNADERLQTEVKAEYKYQIPYQVQYSETDFNYLKRLARQYAEWLFYDGEKLFFGKTPKQTEGKKLMFGTDISKLDICLQTKPHQFSGYTYDIDSNKFIEASAKGDIEGLPPITRGLLEVADKLYSKPAYGAEEYTTLGFEGYLSLAKKNKQLAELADMHYVVGTTDNRTLRIGQRITIFAREIEEIPYMDKRWVAGKVFYKETEISTYIITELYHKATDIGEYQNTFKALPAFVRKLPLPEVEKPTVYSEQAVVINNADPEGKGRVRVRLQWQNNHNGQTPWIFVLSPDAGQSKAVSKNRGFAFTPDVGDNVVVFYLNGDPLQPFVMGSFFDGLSGAGGGANNNQRTLTSREGSMLKFDDGDKSAKLNDASENYLLMDGSGNTRLYAPNLLHLMAKNLIIDVGNDMTVNVQNDLLMNIAEQAVFNVFQKMGINTPHLQQLISSTYHTQAGKALINSQNEIKLESPEMYIAGQKKLFLTSDEVAALNSKGIVKVDGKEGNKHSNKAEAYETIKEDITAKCIVHFRPLNSWKGEFGFDWMRVGDTTIEGDFPYKGNVGRCDYPYKFAPNEEIFNQLELIYNVCNIISKPKDDSTFEKYYVPWLTLFPATALSNPLLKSTDNKAELTMLIYVEVEPEKLILEYDKNLFTSIVEITTKNVTSCDPHEVKLTIECKNSFDTDQIIRVFAISKTANGKEEKLLAGKLTVMKNNDIKTVKVAFFNLKTNINEVDKEKQGLRETEVATQRQYLERYFKQALIIPNIEYHNFDLKSRRRRIIDSYTINYEGRLLVLDKNPSFPKIPFENIQNDNYNVDYMNANQVRTVEFIDFLNSELKVDSVGEDCENYYKVYFYGEKGGEIDYRIEEVNGVKKFIKYNFNSLGGYAKGLHTNSAVMFKNKSFYVTHELMHCFGLRHSFDIGSPFAFPIGYTENIMDYSHLIHPKWDNPSENTTLKTSIATWKWQWDILRNELK